jgi:VIT1/CCC1 family predicted Fe2+/Mn2+ transporter
MDNYPEGEKDEMVEIYVNAGFDEPDARSVIDTLATNKQWFVDHMLVQELGLMPPVHSDKPWQAGFASMVAFMLGGLLPTIVYIAAKHAAWDVPFAIACGLTAAALFCIGGANARLSGRPVARIGTITVMGGFITCGIAYLLGWAVSSGLGVRGDM